MFSVLEEHTKAIVKPWLTKKWEFGWTFGAGLDGAGGADLVAILPPLSTHVLQRHLTHEHGILVLLNVQVLQVLDYLQHMF